MSVIKKMRRQKAVWWERLTPDRTGSFRFAYPVEIDCRWDDASVEFRNRQGQVALSQSVVYVDRVMKAGDRLMEGTLESNEEVTNPLVFPNAFEIQRFDKTPNFKATETLYTAYL